MNTSYLEERSVEPAPFNLNRIDRCLEEHRAHALFLERSSLAALDIIDAARLDGEMWTLWSVEFANESEEGFARTLEAHRILWRYKPRTFAVEWDEEGNFVDSFTPGFYLPGQNRYVEVTAPDCRVSVTARKVRLLRQHYSHIKIDLIFWPVLSPVSILDSISGGANNASTVAEGQSRNLNGRRNRRSPRVHQHNGVGERTGQDTRSA